jgi:hypothetical protein
MLDNLAPPVALIFIYPFLFVIDEMDSDVNQVYGGGFPERLYVIAADVAGSIPVDRSKISA